MGGGTQIKSVRQKMGEKGGGGELCAIKLEAHWHWFSCSLHDIDIVFLGLYLMQQYGFLLAMFLLD